jgi:hypothetical protein
VSAVTRRPKARLVASTTLLHLLGIEALIVAAVMMIVLAVLMTGVPAMSVKARAVGDFLSVRTAQIEMAEGAATHGELPVRPEPLIGLRPALRISDPTAPVLWVCGDRLPPPGFETLPALPEAAASAARFSVCREGRSS